jgi:hypothetical protein
VVLIIDANSLISDVKTTISGVLAWVKQKF